jgi:hypothetical protein
MTSVRSRIGRACTAAKPVRRAASTKPGHRSVAAGQVDDLDGLAGAEALHARALVGLQLEQFQ